MLESSESLDNAGVSVAFSVWESDERLSHTPMDPRSLTHACAVQQGSIASGCCWRNHGQCSVKSSPPNSPHVAVKISKRCFSKKRAEWERNLIEEAEILTVRTPLGLPLSLGSLVLSLHPLTVLSDFFLCWLTYIYTRVCDEQVVDTFYLTKQKTGILSL